jgi:hypothetical protein
MNRLNGSLAPRWRSLSEEVSVPLALCLSTHHPTVYRINSKKNVKFLQPLKSKTIIHALLSFRADRSLSLDLSLFSQSFKALKHQVGSTSSSSTNTSQNSSSVVSLFSHDKCFTHAAYILEVPNLVTPP